MPRDINCKKDLLNGVGGDTYITYYNYADIVRILSTGFLFTPDKIEFDLTLWCLYTPNADPFIGVPVYPGILAEDKLTPLALRFRRLDIPPLFVRLRDINYCETFYSRACQGDINAYWIINPSPGQEYWADPSLCAHNPIQPWMTTIQQLNTITNDPCNPCAPVQLFSANINSTALGLIVNSVIPPENIYKPVQVSAPMIISTPMETCKSRSNIVDKTSTTARIVSANSNCASGTCGTAPQGVMYTKPINTNNLQTTYQNNNLQSNNLQSTYSSNIMNPNNNLQTTYTQNTYPSNNLNNNLQTTYTQSTYPSNNLQNTYPSNNLQTTYTQSTVKNSPQGNSQTTYTQSTVKDNYQNSNTSPYMNTPVTNPGSVVNNPWANPLANPAVQNRALNNILPYGCNTVCCNNSCNAGPWVTDTQIPIANVNNSSVANPITASIVNSYNGRGNLDFNGQSILYDPLIAGKVCRQYPAFMVKSIVNNTASIALDDIQRDRFIVTYVYFKDEFSIATPRTVTLSIKFMIELFNSVRRSLELIYVQDKGIYTNNTVVKYYYLLLSSTLVSNCTPTPEEVMNAYVIWVFTYIGFVGGTHWDMTYWNVGCNGIPTNVPWIPVVNFDFSLYDNPAANFNSTYYSVDYLFTPHFLQYADLLLQQVYVAVEERYRRWCGVAQGGGWYVLMYPSDLGPVDEIYRHLFIVNTVISQELFNTKQMLRTIQLENIARDNRLAALEFNLYAIENKDNPMNKCGTICNSVA